MESSWREQLVAYIAREAKPAEKYGHQPRLYALTQQIAAAYPEADDDILFAAAWLHDLGVFIGHRPEDPEDLSRWDNVAYAVQQAPALLIRFGFHQAKVAPVLDCIRHHQPHAAPQTLEATILRDADILEQLGAIGILRTVSKIGRDTRFHTFSEAVASLTIGIETLPMLLTLPVSRILAEGRIRIHRAFLQAASAESNGLML